MAKMKRSKEDRARAHAERMLQRAQRQQKRAAKLVEKWQRKLADLDRAAVAAFQPRLWPEPEEAESIVHPASPPPAP